MASSRRPGRRTVSGTRGLSPAPCTGPRRRRVKAAGRARVPGEPAWVSERPSRLDPRSPLPLSALFPLSLGARFQDALVQSLSPPTFCREGTVALRGGAISLRYRLNVLQLLRAVPESGARGDEAAWPWTPDRTPFDLHSHLSALTEQAEANRSAKGDGRLLSIAMNYTIFSY